MRKFGFKITLFKVILNWSGWSGLVHTAYERNRRQKTRSLGRTRKQTQGCHCNDALRPNRESTLEINGLRGRSNFLPLRVNPQTVENELLEKHAHAHPDLRIHGKTCTNVCLGHAIEN